MLRIALLLALASATVAQTPRLVPLKPMSEEVEILYGNPEAAGQPFVMRIGELPGGIIPPHRHPVDEHITVVEGTLWFAAAGARGVE
jgi:quercetin dioxygenase-like cupin family protein